MFVALTDRTNKLFEQRGAFNRLGPQGLHFYLSVKGPPVRFERTTRPSTVLLCPTKGVTLIYPPRWV